MWSERLEKISSINEQLSSHVALNIMMNLEDSHSTYAQSFHIVKREIAKVLCYLFKYCFFFKLAEREIHSKPSFLFGYHM